MADGSITLETTLNNDGLKKGINQIDRSFSKLKSLAAKAIGAVGFSKLVKEGVTYNATIEQLQTSFEVMTGSAQKAVEIVQKLKEVGANTPYELTGLAQTTQTLMQYGMSADEAYDATINLGDIAQGSAEKMQSIALAYGQMSSAGKVNMQDIKQMINAGFNPLQAIMEMTGETMAEVTQRYEKGKISVQEVTEAMAYASSENGKYYQSMEKQSQTFNGQWSTLKDNFSSFIGSVLTPLSDTLTTKILPAVNNILSKLSEKIEATDWEKFGNTLNNIFSIIVPLTTAFIAYRAAIMISSIISTVTTALNGMTIAQYALNLAMSLNPVGIVVALIAGLVAGIIYLWNTNEGFRNALISAWEAIKNTAIAVWDWLGVLFTQKIPQWIQNVINWFKELPRKDMDMVS